MRNKMSAKFSSPFLSLVFSFLMLCPLLVVNAQTTSTNLEDTQWIAQPFSMVNVDASITVITSTYYFYKQGKFKLYTFANKGVGISPVDGKLTFPFASDSEVFGTYKVEGKSVYLYFPNETISATISGNRMKGVSTLKGTNKKEEWLVEKFIPENKSTNSVKESSSATSVTAQQQIQAASDNSNNSVSDNSSPLSLSESLISRYNPKPLRTNIISLQSSAAKSFESSSYSFLADKGEVVISISLKAGQESYSSLVGVDVFDRNGEKLGSENVIVSQGNTAKKTIRFNIENKQAVLLRVSLQSYGAFGAYEIELNGAVDFRQ